MAPRHLIVGTAGHIDHGKSALVEALTGIDPDRLKEEKARGITIELGFADLDLGEARVVSFVDVPGHERFVRHMVAGAAGIDAVMLVVAADEGVKPQTREHVDICRLLDVRHGIVVLSKTDLVAEDLLEVVSLELREFVEGSFLEGAPVVPVSARTGEGIEELRTALRQLFGRVPGRRVAGVARLPVDRSFVIKGFGTVVTGSLVSGRLREGAEVEVLPSGGRGRVRGLQVHRQKVAEVLAGQRTAVNLQGLTCAEVPRGSTVAEPQALRTTRRIWASVRLLAAAAERLKAGGPASFHQGTCERRARMRVLGRRDDGELRVEIFLDRPAVLVPGDRFVLRRPAPVNTVGGGVVIDPRPPRGKERLEEFELMESAAPELAVGLRVARAGMGGVSLGELAAWIGRTQPELEDLLAALERDGVVVRAAGLLFDGRQWSATRERTCRTLEEFHRREPLRPGMSREELRARAGGGLSQDGWRELLEGLAAAGDVRLEGERVALADHRVVLSGSDLDLRRRIDSAFREAGLDPPDPESVVSGEDPGRAGRLVELLIDEGRLVRIRSGRLFHADALASLVARLRDFARTSRTIDIGTFKELAGVTRKNAIPLLEHLDEQRLTRRVGNVREILGG